MTFFEIATKSCQKLNEVRSLLDNRFHNNMTDEEFKKLQQTYDDVCKALSNIL